MFGLDRPPLYSSLLLTGAGAAEGPSFAGALDDYTANLAAAWSVARRLLSSYTGPLIRVRRSSDSIEQDIGYDANGDLDTAALLTFCGAGNGFVRYIYDQSGSALDIGQSAGTGQPKIVDAGSYLPAGALFDGVSDYLQTASVAYTALASATAVQVCFNLTADVSATSARLFSFNSGEFNIWYLYASEVYWDAPNAGEAGRIFYTPTSPLGSPKKLSFERDGSTSRIRVDDSVEHSGSVSGTISGTSVLSIGALDGAPASFWPGNIAECVIWKNATDAAARSSAMSL